MSYDSAIGTWVQKDGGYWDGMNLYRSDRSNPPAYTDPRGLEAVAATQPSTQPCPTSDPNQDYSDMYSLQANCSAWAFNSTNVIGTNFADQLDMSEGQLSKMLNASDAAQQLVNQINQMFAKNRFGLKASPSSLDKNQKCPCGWHKVALYTYTAWDPGVKPNHWADTTRDFHWISQDDDGNWSGKGGPTGPAETSHPWAQDKVKTLIGVWCISTPVRTSQTKLENMWNNKHAGGTRGAGFGPTMHE